MMILFDSYNHHHHLVTHVIQNILKVDIDETLSHKNISYIITSQSIHASDVRSRINTCYCSKWYSCRLRSIRTVCTLIRMILTLISINVMPGGTFSNSTGL